MPDSTKTSSDDRYAVMLMPYGDDWHVYAPLTKDEADQLVRRAVKIDNIETVQAIAIQSGDELLQTIHKIEQEQAEYEAQHG